MAFENQSNDPEELRRIAESLRKRAEDKQASADTLWREREKCIEKAEKLEAKR